MEGFPLLREREKKPEDRQFVVVGTPNQLPRKETREISKSTRKKNKSSQRHQGFGVTGFEVLDRFDSLNRLPPSDRLEPPAARVLVAGREVQAVEGREKQERARDQEWRKGQVEDPQRRKEEAEDPEWRKEEAEDPQLRKGKVEDPQLRKREAEDPQRRKGKVEDPEPGQEQEQGREEGLERRRW